MQGKITLEDHFGIPETLEKSPYAGTPIWQELWSRLTDFEDQRLRLMDRAGIEMMVLSLSAPAVQAIPDVEGAAEVARQANDFLAGQVLRRRASGIFPPG